MRILGTFQSRDVADAIKDVFIADGFNAADLIVMANREAAKPPEDARLEVGTEGEGGLKELEEKIGKVVLGFMNKPNPLDGNWTEGEGTDGAILAVVVANERDAEKARALLERHRAADIEVVETL